MGGSSLSPFNIAISYCTHNKQPRKRPSSEVCINSYVLLADLPPPAGGTHIERECVLFNQFSLAQVLLQLPSDCMRSAGDTVLRPLLHNSCTLLRSAAPLRLLSTSELHRMCQLCSLRPALWCNNQTALLVETIMQ
jgi:hypothetical protein